MHRALVILCFLLVSCAITRTMVNTMNATTPNLKSKEMIKALDEHIVPLSEDISTVTEFPFLDSLFDSSQVVGLGVSTHGTKEFYTLKANLARYAIAHHSYRAVAIELPVGVGVYLNRYIRNEPNSSLQPYLGRFWIYNTEEVKQMIEWMRTYNRTAKAGMIQFYGIDPQNNEYALPLLKEFGTSIPSLANEWSMPLQKLES